MAPPIGQGKGDQTFAHCEVLSRLADYCVTFDEDDQAPTYPTRSVEEVSFGRQPVKTKFN